MSLEITDQLKPGNQITAPAQIVLAKGVGTLMIQNFPYSAPNVDDCITPFQSWERYKVVGKIVWENQAAGSTIYQKQFLLNRSFGDGATPTNEFFPDVLARLKSRAKVPIDQLYSTVTFDQHYLIASTATPTKQGLLVAWIWPDFSGLNNKNFRSNALSNIMFVFKLPHLQILPSTDNSIRFVVRWQLPTGGIPMTSQLTTVPDGSENPVVSAHPYARMYMGRFGITVVDPLQTTNPVKSHEFTVMEAFSNVQFSHLSGVPG